MEDESSLAFIYLKILYLFLCKETDFYRVVDIWYYKYQEVIRMLQVIYLPKDSIEIEGFTTISDLDELVELIKFNKIDLLSLPVCGDTFDILDAIAINKFPVKTIHIQQHENLVLRIKVFFSIATIYAENEVKKDVILKHDIIDKALSKNK